MLKEKVIELLKQDPAGLDMSVWLEQLSDEIDCGTVGCFAGYIIRATGINLVCVRTTGHLYPDYDPETLDSFKSSRFYHYEPEIGAFARYLWAKEYGDMAAKALPFYPVEWENEVGFSESQYSGSIAQAFNRLTAQDVIKYLESLP